MKKANFFWSHPTLGSKSLRVKLPFDFTGILNGSFQDVLLSAPELELNVKNILIFLTENVRKRESFLLYIHIYIYIHNTIYLLDKWFRFKGLQVLQRQQVKTRKQISVNKVHVPLPPHHSP